MSIREQLSRRARMTERTKTAQSNDEALGHGRVQANVEKGNKPGEDTAKTEPRRFSQPDLQRTGRCFSAVEVDGSQRQSIETAALPPQLPPHQLQHNARALSSRCSFSHKHQHQTTPPLPSHHHNRLPAAFQHPLPISSPTFSLFDQHSAEARSIAKTNTTQSISIPLDSVVLGLKAAEGCDTQNLAFSGARPYRGCSVTDSAGKGHLTRNEFCESFSDLSSALFHRFFRICLSEREAYLHCFVL